MGETRETGDSNRSFQFGVERIEDIELYGHQLLVTQIAGWGREGGRGGREGGREGGKERGSEGEKREGGREGEKREGEKREGGSEGEREGVREGGREGGEGGRERECRTSEESILLYASVLFRVLGPC